MNELKKTLNTLWTNLSLTQKASIFGSALAVFAVLIAVVYFSSQPKFTLLFANLPSEEASKVVEFLQSRRIAFELGDGGRTVMVPGNRVYELRLALASAGIPRASDTAGGVGFELFDKATFGMSDFMQRANYHRALQGELARTIRQMEEIEEARVMIVAPEDRLFRPDRREAKASVFIKVKPNRSLSQGQVQAVRFLVANGVEGLQPERVAVIDNYGRALAEDQQNNTLLSLSTNQLQIVRSVESHLIDKAQSMLDQVLGPGQAVVRVSAELNFDSVQETSEKFDPTSAVIRSETTTTESNASESQRRSTAVGTTTNTEGPPATAEAGGNASKSEQTRESINNKYEISRTVETRQKASGEIRRLTVAVMINSRRAGATAGGSPARTPQELKQLEEIVKQAVGFTQNDQRQDAIQMQEAEFADLFPTQPEVQDTRQVLAGLTGWLPLASQAFLAVLAIGLFFYFRGLIQDADVQKPKGEFADLLDRFDKLDRAGIVPSVKAGGERAGVLTVDEMSRLIKDNPTNVSQAIKQWLTKN